MIMKSMEHWKFLNADTLAHHIRQLRPRLMVRRRF
jgi:hypothetical protein